MCVYDVVWACCSRGTHHAMVQLKTSAVNMYNLVETALYINIQITHQHLYIYIHTPHIYNIHYLQHNTHTYIHRNEHSNQTKQTKTTQKQSKNKNKTIPNNIPTRNHAKNTTKEANFEKKCVLKPQKDSHNNRISKLCNHLKKMTKEELRMASDFVTEVMEIDSQPIMVHKNLYWKELTIYQDRECVMTIVFQSKAYTIWTGKKCKHS